MILLETQEKPFVICIMTTHGESFPPVSRPGGNVLSISGTFFSIKTAKCINYFFSHTANLLQNVFILYIGADEATIDEKFVVSDERIHNEIARRTIKPIFPICINI